MKTRKKLFLICAIVIFGFYVSVTSLGPGSVFALFSPSSIMYFPSILTQLIANEGNGIICVDACGPCSAWGTYYMMIDGECRNGPDGRVCSNDAFGEQWRFFGGRCAPFNPEKIPYEFSNEYLNADIVSCENVSEHDIVCNHPVKESCPSDRDSVWTWSGMYELCFRMQEQPHSAVVNCSETESHDMLCNPKDNHHVCPSPVEEHNWSYNDIDKLCYKVGNRK